MCFMLYLASARNIPLSLWSKTNPKVAFNEPLIKPKHFSKNNIFYVNSTECCGCGFRQEVDVLHPDFSEKNEKDKNQIQLYEHILGFLNQEDFIELFGCWAGGEDNLENSREIRVIDLIDDDFYFAENELITVKK